MKDKFLFILKKIIGSWRYRWTALALTAVLSLISWTTLLFIPNEYEARTKVFMDTDSILKPLLEGIAVEKTKRNKLKTINQTLRTDENLERIAINSGLVESIDSEVEKQHILKELDQSIWIDQELQENLFSVKYRDYSTEKARNVLEELLKILQEKTIGENQADNDYAQTFLKEQIQEYETRLLTAEKNLADFKRENVGLMPAEGLDYYARLDASNQRKKDFSAQLRSAMRIRDEYQRQLQGEDPLYGGTTLEGSYDAEIQKAGVQLEALRLKYTDEHPDIIAQLEVMDQLKSRRSGLARSGDGRGAGNVNLVYQELKVALGKASAAVADARTKLALEEEEISRLQQQASSMPEVEAKLKVLTRDYKVTKDQYESLQQRQEKAFITEAADQSRKKLNFQVIEPPVASLEPVGPRRFFYSCVLLLLAGALSAALAFFLNELKGKVVSTTCLRDVTYLPILGTISLREDKETIASRRRGFVVFVALCLLLLSGPIGMVLLKDSGPEAANEFKQQFVSYNTESPES